MRSGKLDESVTKTTSETGLSSDNSLNAWRPGALERVAQDAGELARIQEQVMAATRSFSELAFVGRSHSILKIFDLISRIANTDSTVLILGESGTGKELVARALHSASVRRTKPFVPVNCGAIPSELLESELFGHVKGAYTGAHSSRPGRFLLAHQGTLFLDEIGTMPASLQVKLLRALQEKEFEPVGGTKPVRSDCRVVAATNNDLEAEVAAGRFREDLFYRLNVIPISLPSLRQRKDDIPLLVEHFIKRFNESKNCRVQGFTPEAMEIMVRYNWPGNVRELENICQRLCILKGDGVVGIEDIPAKLHSLRPIQSEQAPWAQWMNEWPSDGINLEATVEKFENDLILRALEQTRWNKNKAAQLLRMNRTTLVEKIKKRGLAPGI